MKVTYLDWFKTHERFLLIVLAGLLVLHIWGSGLSAWVKHDERLASQADAATKQVQDALRQQVQNTNALNARIDQLMAQRAIDTSKQKKIDDAAQATEVAARISALLRVKPEEVTASPADNTLKFDSQAAHANVDALEDLQQSRADVLDLSTKLGACTTLSNEQGLALTAEKAAHVADVKAEQAKSKTAFLRGFKWGAITGFIGGVAAHFI